MSSTIEKTHEWHDPATMKHPSRSACPALNAMANHNYLPQDGRNITVWELIAALQICYKLSAPLAYLIGFGGFLLLRNFTFKPLDLQDINRHGRGIHSCVEHDASLVHEDTSPGDLYAPIRVIPKRVAQLMADANTERDQISKSQRVLMSVDDVAHSRVRVERISPPLNGLHAEIARGEMAITLGIWSIVEPDNEGVPVELIQDWIAYDRLPERWRPTKTVGLWETIKKAREIKLAMRRLTSTDAQSTRTSTVPAAAINLSRAASTAVNQFLSAPRMSSRASSSAGSEANQDSSSEDETSEL